MAQTNEHAFETYVMEMLTGRGWVPGSVSEWDKDLALFPSRVTAFVAETQPELWGRMRDLHAGQLETMVIKALVKELAVKGCLHILRHGFKFYGKTFQTAYFKPAHGLNPEMLERYVRNELTVIRQVPCHPGDHSTMDLVLALNGLPVATCELKNPRTGQNWRHAIRQYQNDQGIIHYHTEDYDSPVETVEPWCWRCHMTWHKRYKFPEAFHVQKAHSK